MGRETAFVLIAYYLASACALRTSSHAGTVLRSRTVISTSLCAKQEKDEGEGTVLSSSLLIAGTTIGGGFLALPRATAPAGFLPSVVGLVASWLFLLSSSLSLVDATILTTNAKRGNDVEPVSIFRIGSAVGGPVAASLVGGSFCVLMVSTLVAQMSKAGSLLSDSLAPAVRFAPSLCTLAFSALSYLATFGPGGVAMAERINSFLTTVMLASFVGVAASAAAIADPSRLARTNWVALIPFGSGRAATWSIPVLLQLLVYSETVPFVVGRLGGDRKKIRTAIAAGSFLPLLMCVVWTAAAICAAPYSPAAFDPVQTLLGASQSTSLRLFILALAASAITTTAIGSLLTMEQFFQDALALRGGRVALARALAIVPCTLVAAIGSRSLYYYATAFAGMFPVLLLWGLFPPLAFLRLRAGQKSSGGGGGGGVEVVLARVNVVISIAVLSVNLLSFLH